MHGTRSSNKKTELQRKQTESALLNKNALLKINSCAAVQQERSAHLETPLWADLSEEQINLQALRNAKVLVIGDLMLDTYYMGQATRISPEAPVPVVHITSQNYHLGGAGNVARNIAALGGKATLLGMVGCDEAGRKLETMLEAAGINPCLLRCPERPTTQKTRVLAQNQQMIRLDHEQVGPVEPCLREQWAKLLAEHIPGYAVIIFSDYGKGCISDDLIKQIAEICTEKSLPMPCILVDPKPQHATFYEHSFLMTPNAKESSEMAHLPISTRAEVVAVGTQLKTLGVRHALTTLGADGMALFTAEGPIWHIPTAARQVFDVTGAGDTVIATLALALAAQYPLLEACVLANFAAGLVVAQVGAAVPTVDALRKLFAAREIAIERWA